MSLRAELESRKLQGSPFSEHNVSMTSVTGWHLGTGCAAWQREHCVHRRS